MAGEAHVSVGTLRHGWGSVGLPATPRSLRARSPLIRRPAMRVRCPEGRSMRCDGAEASVAGEIRALFATLPGRRALRAPAAGGIVAVGSRRQHPRFPERDFPHRPRRAVGSLLRTLDRPGDEQSGARPSRYHHQQADADARLQALSGCRAPSPCAGQGVLRGARRFHVGVVPVSRRTRASPRGPCPRWDFPERGCEAPAPPSCPPQADGGPADLRRSCRLGARSASG